MNTLIRAMLIAAVLVFTAGPALGQETLNTDAIREQIKKLEAIAVEGRSGTLQRAHKSALAGLYQQLQSALQQEIDDLKKIQALTASSDTATRQEIANQLNKLTSENSDVNTKIANLGSPSQPPATDVSSAMTAGNPSGPASTATSPAPGTPTNPGTPAASQGDDNLNTILNTRIQEAVRARIQQRETTKQAEPPSVANNSTSLVNMSSAGDLVNVGFALAGLTSDNNGANAADSVSVTASAYAFYALAKNVDPLNPGFYNRHSGWRRLSFTLGYDNEKLLNGTTEKAPIFGFKYLFIDKRDPSRQRHQKDFETIGKNLRKASVAFGNLSEKVRYSFAKNSLVREKLLIPQFRVFLSERLSNVDPNSPAAARIKGLQKKLDAGDTDDFAGLFVLNSDGIPPNFGEPGVWSPEELKFYSENFQNTYLAADYRAKLKAAVGQKALDDLDAFITEQLTDVQAFEDLSDVTREALERIRRAPQFSFNFLTKQRSETDDEYHAETTFDYGLVNRVNLTLNGSFLYRDSQLVGGDTRGGKFAGQFRFQLTPENLAGRNPFFLFLSGNSELLSGRKPLYKAQAKVNIPVLNGVDFPFSLTYANRNEVGGEKNKTRLQFGFAVDTARILQALTSR